MKPSQLWEGSVKALVIYDSVFGNTEKVARAIGEALKTLGEVQVARVSEVQPAQLAGLKLLIVGSPTRGFRPTVPITSFLAMLPEGSLKGVKVAVFDTRVELKDIPFFFRGVIKRGGYADKPITETLQQKGGELAAPSVGFFVKGKEGSLKAGELERAAAWARSLPLVAG